MCDKVYLHSNLNSLHLWKSTSKLSTKSTMFVSSQSSSSDSSQHRTPLSQPTECILVSNKKSPPRGDFLLSIEFVDREGKKSGKAELLRYTHRVFITKYISMSLSSVQNCMKEFSLPKTLGLAWVLFTTLYFLFSVALPYVIGGTQQAVMNGAFANGQQDGYVKAFMQLGGELQKQLQGGCKEPVAVQLGSGVTVGIVSTNCLQQPQQAPQAGGPTGPEAPAPAAK